MKSLFIATVGMGTGLEADITKPLIKSIREANPDFLLLFASSESKENAEKIIKQLKRTENDSEICIIKTINDVEKIFQQMNDKVTEFFDKGEYCKEKTIVDFTTGTKPMSAALVLIAIKFRCGHLKYISVERNAEKKVIEGSERSITFEPLGIFASYTIENAVEFIRRYQFNSAISLLEPIKNVQKGLLSESDKFLVENLILIAEAYDCWDKFNHIQFKNRYEKIKFGHHLLEMFRITNKDIISQIHQIGEDLNKEKISAPAIVDLLNNAHRRIEEGKYDDAVARLYRVIEMIGQWRLIEKYGQKSNDINLKEVPNKSKEWLEKKRDEKDGKIKIGLQAVYQLLEDYDDELGKDFNQDNKLRGLLQERNNSILAHGTKPITKEKSEELYEHIAENYGKKYIDNFDQLKKDLSFPWST